MPLLEPEPTDPHELVGVGLPAPDDSSIREMAACFVEEYLRLGFSPERIRSMFEKPFYAGAHEAYRVLGRAAIDRLIEEKAELFRPRPSPCPIPNPSTTRRS